MIEDALDHVRGTIEFDVQVPDVGVQNTVGSVVVCRRLRAPSYENP